MTPCVEAAAVWTVPGAVSPGCILAEPRQGDKLTPGGNESGGFGASKRQGNVGIVSCVKPSMLRRCGKLGTIGMRSFSVGIASRGIQGPRPHTKSQVLESECRTEIKPAYSKVSSRSLKGSR